MIACTCSTSVVHLSSAAPGNNCTAKQVASATPMHPKHDSWLEPDQTNYGVPDMDTSIRQDRLPLPTSIVALSMLHSDSLT